MTLVRWKPVHGITRGYNDFSRELNRFFGNFHGEDGESSGKCSYCPSLDISETKDDISVNVELPGVSSKDVNITLEDDVLTIKGEKKFEEEDNDKNYYRAERSYGTFQRSFTLPTEVKKDKIKADFKDGILSISIPKAEKVKPKKIEIAVK